MGESVYTEPKEQSLSVDDRTRIGAFSGPMIPTVQIQNTIEQKELVPNFSYGAPTNGTWEKVDNNTQAAVGDILRITYTMGIPFFQDWQRDYIVSTINKDKRFILRSVSLNEEIRRVVIEVEVIQDFSPAFLIPIVIIGLLAGALIYLTTASVEKLSTVQIGDFKIKGTPFLAIFLVLAGLFVFYKVR